MDFREHQQSVDEDTGIVYKNKDPTKLYYLLSRSHHQEDDRG